MNQLTINFCEKLAPMKRISIGETYKMYQILEDDINRETGLVGDALENRAHKLFLQANRNEIAIMHNSATSQFKLLVLGVSRLNNKISFTRNGLVTKYIKNPNDALKNGFVNEYEVIGEIVNKYSLNTKTNKIDKEVVSKVSENAEEIGDNTFVAPRDIKKLTFDKKPNENYGNELPLNQYVRDVYGVAADQEGDIRKFRLTLRGERAVDNYPEIGETYLTRILNMTKDTKDEYVFYDHNLTTWYKNAWNPFDSGSFIENILENDIMGEFIKQLGDLRGLAEAEFNEKERNKERFASGEQRTYENIQFNACYFVKADIMTIQLEPPNSTKINKVTVDDESCQWDITTDGSDSIIGWLSEAATEAINFGEGSRVWLCCYPKIIKNKDESRNDSMFLEVYGMIPLEGVMTKKGYKICQTIKDEDLSE